MGSDCTQRDVMIAMTPIFASSLRRQDEHLLQGQLDLVQAKHQTLHAPQVNLDCLPPCSSLPVPAMWPFLPSS